MANLAFLLLTVCPFAVAQLKVPLSGGPSVALCTPIPWPKSTPGCNYFEAVHDQRYCIVSYKCMPNPNGAATGTGDGSKKEPMSGDAKEKKAGGDEFVKDSKPSEQGGTPKVAPAKPPPPPPPVNAKPKSGGGGYNGPAPPPVVKATTPKKGPPGPPGYTGGPVVDPVPQSTKGPPGPPAKYKPPVDPVPVPTKGPPSVPPPPKRTTKLGGPLYTPRTPPPAPQTPPPPMTTRFGGPSYTLKTAPPQTPPPPMTTKYGGPLLTPPRLGGYGRR